MHALQRPPPTRDLASGTVGRRQPLGWHRAGEVDEPQEIVVGPACARHGTATEGNNGTNLARSVGGSMDRQVGRTSGRADKQMGGWSVGLAIGRLVCRSVGRPVCRAAGRSLGKTAGRCAIFLTLQFAPTANQQRHCISDGGSGAMTDRARPLLPPNRPRNELKPQAGSGACSTHGGVDEAVRFETRRRKLHRWPAPSPVGGMDHDLDRHLRVEIRRNFKRHSDGVTIPLCWKAARPTVNAGCEPTMALRVNARLPAHTTHTSLERSWVHSIGRPQRLDPCRPLTRQASPR